jgi:hypothetical protein
MALILQNDTGTVTDANSYTDTTFADNYFLLRNNATWAAATVSDKEAAMVRAWQYMDTAFNYDGYKVTDIQNTEFPRYSIFNDRGTEILGINFKIKNAQCEFALIALSADLTINQVPINTPVVKSKMSKADVLQESVTYDTEQGQQTRFYYPQADFWLKDFIKGTTFRGYY